MKHFLTLLFLAFLGLASNAQIKKVPYKGAFAPAPTPMWTAGWSNFDPQNTVYRSNTTTPGTGKTKLVGGSSPSVISKNTTWYADTVYTIANLVYVKSGVTLTIQPGTLIYGSTAYANSSLIINRGAKIIAEGTVDSPIVFTSPRVVGFRKQGDWGGLIILGKAAVNQTSDATGVPNPGRANTAYIEGITAIAADTTGGTGQSTEYGGGNNVDDNDSSGILKYVRVEFGGYILAQNKEINGVTFGGVGRKTVVDYVQCSYINDDSFEWFGGTVNCSHLISYANVDDEFDTDFGYSGTVQFGLGVRRPDIGDDSYSLASSASTSEGYESDNDANGSYLSPRTKALFVNMTHIGPLRGNNSTANQAAIHPGFRRIARLRRSTQLKIQNSVLCDYPTGLYVDNSNGNAANSLDSGFMKFRGNILGGVASGKLVEVTSGATGANKYPAYSGTTYPAYITTAKDTLAKYIRERNDSAGAATSYLTLPYGTSTFSSVNYAAPFTTADYRPKTSVAAGVPNASTGADWSDTTYADATPSTYGWTFDTCYTPSAPDSVRGTSTTVNYNNADTLKTFTAYSSVANGSYIWTITGTGNSIKSGQYSDQIVAIFKTPGTISASRYNSCGSSSAVTVDVTCLKPAKPSSITGVSSVGFAADSIQTFSVDNDPLGTYTWTITGTGNSITSGQGTNSISVILKSAAVVAVKVANTCASSDTTAKVVSCITPSKPSAITGVSVVGTGSDSVKTFSVTNVAGTRYTWNIIGTGNSIVSGQGTNSVTVILKREATISVTASNLCATSDTVAKVVPCAGSLANLSAISGNSNVQACTGVQFNYSVNNVAGLTYVWSSTGINNFIISGQGTNSISVGVTGSGTLKVVAYDNCNITDTVRLNLYKTALANPTVAPVITPLVTNVCGGKKYLYTAPVLPAGATGYSWTRTGLALTGATIDSGSATSKFIVLKFSSDVAAAAGDSVKYAFTSDCGLATGTKAVKLNNTALAGPAQSTVTGVQTLKNVCSNRRFQFTAGALAAATSTAVAGTGYEWNFTGTKALASYVIDSFKTSTGSWTATTGTTVADIPSDARYIVAHFTDNSAFATTDSVRVRITSNCAANKWKGLKIALSTALTNPTPATLVKSTVSDVCGNRVFRYTAPASFPAATATVPAPTGYLWELPAFGSPALNTDTVCDLTSRIIRVKYNSNSASATTDLIKLYYTSACVQSVAKTLAIGLAAKTGCFSFARVAPEAENTAAVSPNPNNGFFTLNVKTGVINNTTAFVQIIDLTGKVVKSMNVQNNNGSIVSTIVADNLANGVYIVKYTVGNVTNTTRMMIRK